MTEPCNIAATLPRMAAERGDQVAMRCPGSRGSDGFARYDIALTYAQLDARSDAIAAGLVKYGIVRGVRTVLMVRPSPEFFLLMFALFKLGAVPVLVDPGIDRRALKECLDEAQPQAFIGIPLAHAARIALGWARCARIRVTVGRRWFWRGATLDRIEALGANADAQLANTQPDDIAAILFTSGSTGVPKGVVYRHRHFVAQIGMLRDAFGIEPGGVDLPTFPPFALFDPALGLTSIIPDMDPTRPALADPEKLHDAIARFGVTQLFGSPALVDVLARFGAKLPTIHRVTSAGAPVPPDVVTTMRALLPDDAQLWTPYGATECLPVAVIEGRELQSTREFTERGAETCVGRPVPPNRVRIIWVTDDAIAEWSDALLVATGAIGEITVAGPTATDSYFNRPEATMLAKIVEHRPDGECIVHRMGDVGYFDDDGRLWFCGRKSHRVETTAGPMYTEQAEPIFNTVPVIRRTALVGVGSSGNRIPVLCYETVAGPGHEGRAGIEGLRGALARNRRKASTHRGHHAFPASSGLSSRHPPQCEDRPREAGCLGRAEIGGKALKVLVTGGGGFLGQAICRLLVAHGYDVASYNRGLYPELEALGVRQIRGDLADAAAMCAAAGGMDAVFHNAAKAGAWGSYESYRLANVVGTDNVLAACRAHGIARLVYTSTPSVTHRASHPVEGGNEIDTPYGEDFKAAYSITKTIAEKAVLAANDATLATIALRPRLIWGPGDNQLLPRLVERARAGRLRFVGDGDNRIDSTYIDNAAQAHLDAFDHLAVGAPCAGKPYFISNGEPRTARDTVNALLGAVGAPLVEAHDSLRSGLSRGRGARSRVARAAAQRRAADDALPRRTALDHALVRHLRRAP